MKVTACEMSDDREGFEEEWEKLKGHVRKESSEVVLLPEMPFHQWFCAEPKFDSAEWRSAVEDHDQWMDRLAELGATTVLGTRPVEKGGVRHNEGFVWTKGGGAKGVQLKNYLPNEPGFYEASWYRRGDRKFRAFEGGRWKGGFMICSDLWSMATAREYGRNGVQVIFSPRATGRGSLAKWLAGGTVAAVVSGAYSISSNRRGKRGDAEFGGMGWVVDPDGRLLAKTSEGRPSVTVDLDMRKADESKDTYPRSSLKPD